MNCSQSTTPASNTTTLPPIQGTSTAPKTLMLPIFVYPTDTATIVSLIRRHCLRKVEICAQSDHILKQIPYRSSFKLRPSHVEKYRASLLQPTRELSLENRRQTVQDIEQDLNITISLFPFSRLSQSTRQAQHASPPSEALMYALTATKPIIFRSTTTAKPTAILRPSAITRQNV